MKFIIIFRRKFLFNCTYAYDLLRTYGYFYQFEFGKNLKNVKSSFEIVMSFWLLAIFLVKKKKRIMIKKNNMS